jgi:hypothetical protein
MKANIYHSGALFESLMKYFRSLGPIHELSCPGQLKQFYRYHSFYSKYYQKQQCDYTRNRSFQKRSTLPPRRKFLPSGGGGETKLFLIIVNVSGHPKGVGGLTYNFLCGGGMDVFCRDSLRQLRQLVQPSWKFHIFLVCNCRVVKTAQKTCWNEVVKLFWEICQSSFFLRPMLAQ